MKRLVISGTLLAAAAGATGYFIAVRNPLKADKAADEFLPFLQLLIDIGAKVDWLNALLITCGFAVLLFLAVAQLTPGDGFDLRAMAASRVTNAEGRMVWGIEPGRVFQSGAFMVTTWGFIALVAHDKLTELYLGVYVVLWGGSRAINQIVASKWPTTQGSYLIEAQPPPVPPQPAVVTTTTTEIKTP